LFAYAAHIRLTARGEADLYGYIEQIRLTRVALRLGPRWRRVVFAARPPGT